MGEIARGLELLPRLLEGSAYADIRGPCAVVNRHRATGSFSSLGE
jgi:hypothetical protein